MRFKTELEEREGEEEGAVCGIGWDGGSGWGGEGGRTDIEMNVGSELGRVF